MRIVCKKNVFFFITVKLFDRGGSLHWGTVWKVKYEIRKKKGPIYEKKKIRKQ